MSISVSSTKHFYTAKQARRRRMTNPDDLTRFALTAIRGSHDLNRLRVANLIKRTPKARGTTTVVGVTHDPNPLPVADPLGPFTAELKLVA
jgi:hypothetical protein